MRKHILVFFLLGAMVSVAPSSADAQVFSTGPAGLARQMPRIYGPYMANRARIKYRQKYKHRRHQRRYRTSRVHR